jgi:ABC-type Mn2+/Zn2+ transport system permease subunit
MQWGESIYGIVALSVISAVAAVVVALYVSYQFDLPASFCITMLLCAGYFIGLIKNYVVKA